MRKPQTRFENLVYSSGWDSLLITTLGSTKNQKYVGMTIDQIARIQGKDPYECAFDFLIEENCNVTMVISITDEMDILNILRYPYSSIISDSVYPKSGLPHPRLYGSFPKVLAEFVRDKKVLELPAAIRKMTSQPAQLYQLKKKGLIREGYDADVTVFDLDEIACDASYFVPYSYITSGFYYNKTEWKEMGLEAPDTWSEFIDCAKAFQAAGKPFLQVEGTQYDYSAYYYYLLTERVVGNGELLKAAQDPTGAAWDNPGFLKAAELVYQLSQAGENYFASGYSGNVWPAGQSDFALGGVGALLCGSWIPVELGSQVDEEWEWGYFPMPAVEGYDGTVYDMEAYQIGWAIPTGAKNVDAAKKFMQYATTKANSDLYVNISNNMSARKDTVFPAVLSDIEHYLVNAKSFYLSYDGIAAYASEWTNNVFYPTDLKLLAGQITPEEFIDTMKTETIKFYENK